MSWGGRGRFAARLRDTLHGAASAPLLCTRPTQKSSQIIHTKPVNIKLTELKKEKEKEKKKKKKKKNKKEEEEEEQRKGEEEE